MGSLISPVVANLFTEEFETKTISAAANPPRLWRRYVDDTIVIQKTEYGILFLQHLNSSEHHIQFSKEELNTDGSIP